MNSTVSVQREALLSRRKSLSLTVAVSTTRSGAGAAPTVTLTADEQLLVVSDSSDTASTQAP